MSIVSIAPALALLTTGDNGALHAGDNNSIKLTALFTLDDRQWFEPQSLDSDYMTERNCVSDSLISITGICLLCGRNKIYYTMPVPFSGKDHIYNIMF